MQRDNGEGKHIQNSAKSGRGWEEGKVIYEKCKKNKFAGQQPQKNSKQRESWETQMT